MLCRRTRRLQTLALAVTFIMVGLTGHSEAAVDFNKQIKPIFEARCTECHGPVKPKGKYDMHTKASFFKGSDGEAVIKGKPDESYIVELITLPAGDPDIMPAKGDPLTKEQIELIKTWIKEGANWPDGVDLKFPKKAGPPPDPLNTPGKPITDAEKKAVSDAQAKGALAMRLAQNTNWLRVDFSLHGKEIKDSDIAVVKPMTNLVDLDLGGTQVTDAALAHVAGLTNLHRLHLERTKITGKGLGQLKNLQELRYLNLYGTQVDDKSIMALAELKKLKRLYLWQTKVTDAAAKKLEAAIPGLYINLGWKAEAPKPKPVDPNAPKFTRAEIMQKAMKGGLAKKASEGKANKDELKLLLEYVTALQKHKAPKGDAGSWKAKTDVLVAAVTLLNKGDKKGEKALALGMDCKACHQAHKP